jgi:hypothetical protein
MSGKLMRDMERIERFRKAVSLQCLAVRDHEFHQRRTAAEDDTDSDSEETDIVDIRKARNDLQEDLEEKLEAFHAFISGWLENLKTSVLLTEYAKHELKKFNEALAGNQSQHGGPSSRWTEDFMHTICGGDLDDLLHELVHIEADLGHAHAAMLHAESSVVPRAARSRSRSPLRTQ